MDKNTIIVFTADHGELGGNHQMRGKGNSTYRQQNHLPLMIVHPAYPGGGVCQAVTSQIDLTPTLMALTGSSSAALKKAGSDLKGRDFSSLMSREQGQTRLAAARLIVQLQHAVVSGCQMGQENGRLHEDSDSPLAVKIKTLLKVEPDFYNRCAIRSVFDGRYRFSRYFARSSSILPPASKP